MVGRVVTPQGEPLEKGTVTVVAPTRGGTEAVAQGEITDGRFDVESDPGPVWGLTIDDLPVVVVPVAAEKDSVDVGVVRLLAKGVETPAFHSVEGRVFAIPQAPTAEPRAPERPTNPTLPGGAIPTLPRVPIDDVVLPRLPGGAVPRIPVTELPDDQLGADLTSIVGNLGGQISAARGALAGIGLVSADVSVRGVPTILDDTVGFVFPAAGALSGLELSEMKIGFRPVPDDVPEETSTSPVSVPNVVGYARQLAVRKLASSGLGLVVHSSVAKDAEERGRVIRQIPAAGTQVEMATIVQIFVGTSTGA
jgi:hypothetical protein